MTSGGAATALARDCCDNFFQTRQATSDRLMRILRSQYAL